MLAVCPLPLQTDRTPASTISTRLSTVYIPSGIWRTFSQASSSCHRPKNGLNHTKTCPSGVFTERSRPAESNIVPSVRIACRHSVNVGRQLQSPMPCGESIRDSNLRMMLETERCLLQTKVSGSGLRHESCFTLFQLEWDQKQGKIATSLV